MISVDPIGAAGPAFLNAARRNLVAHWRYVAATTGGSAVPSTTFVTLHFQLNGYSSSGEGWRTWSPGPIFHEMSWFPRPSSPREAVRDLMAFLRHRSREQVIGGSLAILVTAVIVIEFLVDANFGTAPPPQITYVQLYSSNRTDADIIADQKKDEAAKQAAQKEQQRQYQKLEKYLGM